jgi:hypothetical protein
MKRSMYILLFILLLVFIPNLYSQEKLSGNVFSSGGNFSNNLLYNLRGTAGQVLLGKNSNTINFNNVGFWYIKKDVITNTEEEHDNLPKIFSLSQNYPNPFNPSTTIRFAIPRVSNVEIVVYDIIGQRVMTLVNEIKQPGNYSVVFNANNLASGVYFYRIHAGNFIDTKKLILLK